MQNKYVCTALWFPLFNIFLRNINYNLGSWFLCSFGSRWRLLKSSQICPGSWWWGWYEERGIIYTLVFWYFGTWLSIKLSSHKFPLDARPRGMAWGNLWVSIRWRKSLRSSLKQVYYAMKNGCDYRINLHVSYMYLYRIVLDQID